MQDPSQGIQRELQPHVHLVSTYRFPHFQALHPDKVTEWLMAAPKIARDQAPFYWTYLDRPSDGTILLTWQSAALGPDAPSDGYIWAGMEVPFQLEVAGGFTLEMFHHKIGYGQGEPVATHTRRRYRLLPSKYPHASGPAPDMSLWIVHYSSAGQGEHVPSNVIPLDMRMQNMINTRTYLQSQGQIVQKEFMLHDRSNWPQISFPRAPPRGAPMYGANMGPARVPQTMAYPTQHPAPGPPTKRARTQPSVSQVAAAGGSAVLDIDDEEDTSRGDLFDHITPREISIGRYKQNHEWLEEVLSSPYALRQIIPVDLGLGLRGELGSLTEGVFDAPHDPEKDIEKYNYVGRLDEGKADKFRAATQERIAEMNKDMEKMREKHAKRLAKFQKNALIAQAEMELRTAVDNPAETGPEYWRLEGKVESDSEGEARKPSRTPAKVDDILAQVEASLNKHAVVVHEIRRIQDGGYQASLSAPTPLRLSPPPMSPPASHNGSHNSGLLIGDADMDMGTDSAAGLLDQFHTGLSSNATPGSNFPTPLPHLHGASSSGTPNMHIPSPQPAMQESRTPQNHHGEHVHDTAKSDQTAPDEHATAGDTTNTGDWVVVPPGGISPTQSGAQATQSQHPLSVNNQQTHLPVSAPPSASTHTPRPALISEHTPTNLTTTETNTPLPDFHTSPSNDFGDLGDLDSAGDALADYHPDELSGGLGADADGGDDLGGELGNVDMSDLGLDLGDADMGLDDSAFGEAFHGVEAGREGGNGGEGM